MNEQAGETGRISAGWWIAICIAGALFTVLFLGTGIILALNAPF